MEEDSIDMEDDLKMTVSTWKIKVSIWDILSLCSTPPGRAGRVLLAKSLGAIQRKRRGFKICWMMWRDISARSYLHAPGPDGASTPGAYTRPLRSST
jgi:hypothetical protein